MSWYEFRAHLIELMLFKNYEVVEIHESRFLIPGKHKRKAAYKKAMRLSVDHWFNDGDKLKDKAIHIEYVHKVPVKGSYMLPESVKKS